MSAAGPLLAVEDLRVSFSTEDGTVHAVDGISYELAQGATLGIVGESGSGKSVSSLTTMGLTRAQGADISGRILFGGRDLLSLPEGDMRAIRGNDIAMIFQDPLSSLHPFFKIGAQLIEAVRAHRDVSEASARSRAVELLGLVGISDPRRRVDEFPHEFSGGMRQRVMIAMALSCNPRLLIADEPTTALDVTIQAQILDLIRELQVRLGLAVILVTHDLGIVSEYADDVTILYAARVMEQAPSAELFRNPLNPYTRGLLESIPGIDGNRSHRLQAIPGSIPSALNPPAGCRFHPRCSRAIPQCSAGEPPLENKGPNHYVACIRA